MNNNPRSVKKTLKIITTQLLLGFLILVFGVWGIGDIVRGGSQMNVAKVGDRLISIGTFQQEFQQIRADAEGKMPPEMLDSEAFKQQVMAKLVQNALVEEIATAAGIVVAEDAVATKLRRDPFFQDLKGKFNADMFQKFLASQLITEGQFVDSIARQTRAQTLVAAYQMDQVHAMPALAALEAFSAAETRDVFVAELSASSVSVPEPNDTQLQEFYESSKENMFMNPETRDLITLEISAQTLQRAAKEKASENTSTAVASAALIQTLSDTLDDAVASGASFADIATKLPVTAKTRNHAGVQASSASLDQALAQQAFTLDQAQASSFITQKDGSLAAVYVARITHAQPKAYKAVAAQIQTLVRDNLRARALAEKAHALAADLKEAKGDIARQEVATRHGARSNLLQAATRNNTHGNLISLSLLSEIFNKEVGSYIAPAPTENGMVIPVVTAIYSPKNSPKPNKSATDQALRIIQGMVSNALLNDFEKQIPVTLYPLPEMQAR